MRLVPFALALTLLAVAAPAATAAKLHECQHPVRTGEEAYNLRHVTVKTACTFVRRLGRWLGADEKNYARLYGCHRPKPDEAGTPYLRTHYLFGWHLRNKGYVFTAYRGKSSFSVTGTDFPLNCT